MDMLRIPLNPAKINVFKSGNYKCKINLHTGSVKQLTEQI